MRKRAFLALMLVAALVLTSSCALIYKDPVVDQETTIIEVAGKTFTKQQVNEQVTQELNYMAAVYSMYGLSYDPTSASNIASTRQSVLDGLVEQAVREQKVAEMGLDTFTEEELAELQTSTDTTYASYIETVKTNEFADTELEGEALDTAIAERMTELGYITKDELLESNKTTASLNKLREEVVKDVTVSTEEEQTAYDAHVAADTTTYTDDPGAYGTAVTNGTTVYYAPEGYRYVKHILINMTDADQTAINDLNTQLTSKQSEQTTAQTSLDALAADDETLADQRAELNATIKTLSTEIAELQTQLDAARETAYTNIQPTVDEVLAKLAAGEDFDALMETYGQDPGMQASPAKEQGYLVSSASTNWVTEFRDGAMALQSIGDVSPAVRSTYGIHIIKYVSDLASGAVPFETVQQTIHDELLSEKQDTQYTETVAQWVTEANAKVYADRLDD